MAGVLSFMELRHEALCCGRGLPVFLPKYIFWIALKSVTLYKDFNLAYGKHK